MPEWVRQVILFAAGLAALAYALWPPQIEWQYLGVAALFLGLEPLIQGYRRANGKT